VKPLRIVQISDIHLLADTQGELLGVKTQESFQAVLDLVRHHSLSETDIIILTGDITQDYSETAYARVATLLEPLGVPVYWVPGNHDDTHVMERVYPMAMVKNHKHILHENWQIILLNSQKRGAVEGYLDESQLNYLRECLQTHPNHHAAIMFHHQPAPVGCQWLDNLWLTNANEFWAITAAFNTVKAVFFGHVHQVSEQAINGVPIFSAPSTCIQFMRQQDQFGLEKLPPGYREINLLEDGRIETTVYRAANYVGHFDPTAKGY
jgi:Icc protein